MHHRLRSEGGAQVGDAHHLSIPLDHASTVKTDTKFNADVEILKLAARILRAQGGTNEQVKIIKGIAEDVEMVVMKLEDDAK